jgi:hypothetical protein
MIEALRGEGLLPGLLLGMDRLGRPHFRAADRYGTVVPGPDGGPLYPDPPRFRDPRPVRWTARGGDSQLLEAEGRRLRDRISAAPPGERAALARGITGLVGSGESVRAAGEFTAFRRDRPGSALVADAALLEGLALLFAGRAGDALHALREAPETPLALLVRACAHLRRVDFPRALVELDRLRASGHGREARVMELMVRLVIRDEAGAERALAGLANEDPEGPWARVREEVRQRGDLPSRSPVVAGLLSALCPGGGQLYTGRPVDAVGSFFAVALFAAGSWAAFEGELDLLGWLSGAIALAYHAGGVAGAVRSAHRRNETEERAFLDRVADLVRRGEACWALDARDRRSLRHWRLR